MINPHYTRNAWVDKKPVTQAAANNKGLLTPQSFSNKISPSFEATRWMLKML